MNYKKEVSKLYNDSRGGRKVPRKRKKHIKKAMLELIWYGFFILLS